MSKQGIYKISGNTKPKVGELVTYKIDEWYPATPREKRNPALVTWHLFKKVNGKFVPTNIKKKGISSFTFNSTAYKDTFRIEAYLHSPEGKAPMALVVQPQPSDVPRINKVELKYIDNSPGTVFSFMEKLVAEAKCMNLEGQYLQFTLWEDDAKDAGHHNKNLLIDSKKEKVINGTARAEFTLTHALMKKAMEGETNPQQLQFYVTVEYYSNKKHATNNVNINTPEELRTPPRQPQPQPQQPAPAPEQPIEPQTAHGQANNTQPATPPISGGVSPTIINPVKTEDLLDAYFAKKEYTRQTGEEDGTHTYTFGGSKSGNKTATAEEKNKVAQTILGKIKDSLKSQKKYTTLEVIAAALTAEAYGKDTVNQKTVTFKTFKLGADFKKVDTAPLDDKLYLVARTMLLDGKQVTISIKEKDGIIKGTADAVLPVLEITEEQMAQKTPAGQAVPGSEKTVFTGTVKDNMVKIPIHLRPKSEEELKQWKDKISKGKEDGTYTYTFGSATNIDNETKKTSIAKIILDNAKKGNAKNPKIENGKSSSEEEIKKALAIKNYQAGDAITFKLLKKVPEFLYLHAKAQGEKQYDKKFLNKEGAYFQIGKKCECEERVRAFMRVIRIAEGTGEYVKGSKIPRNPELGYTTWFSGGGNNFSDLTTHPQTINCNSTKTLCSSAAGAYQIMGWKFDELNGYLIQEHNNTYKTVKPLVYTVDTDLAKKYNAKGFSKISQDRLCLIILMKKNIIPSILKGNIEEAIDKAKGIWVSLPGATAGQPTAKMQETLDYYNEFFEKENSKESNLHVLPGFLKEFGYECQCEEEDTSSLWHDPIDNPEITLYNFYGNYNPAGSSFGLVRNNGTKNHQGLDIFAPTGTEVKACLDGKVVIANQNDGNWGKLVVIEIKKEDLDNSRRDYKLQYDGEIEKGANYGASNHRFLRYAHLSKILVSDQQLVKAGDVIGLSGKTGNAENQHIRARHLHFDIANVKNAGTGTGQRENPAFYVRLVPPNNDRQKNNTN